MNNSKDLNDIFSQISRAKEKSAEQIIEDQKKSAEERKRRIQESIIGQLTGIGYDDDDDETDIDSLMRLIDQKLEEEFARKDALKSTNKNKGHGKLAAARQENTLKSSITEMKKNVPPELMQISKEAREAYFEKLTPTNVMNIIEPNARELVREPSKKATNKNQIPKREKKKVWGLQAPDIKIKEK